MREGRLTRRRWLTTVASGTAMVAGGYGTTEDVSAATQVLGDLKGAAFYVRDETEIRFALRFSESVPDPDSDSFSGEVLLDVDGEVILDDEPVEWYRPSVPKEGALSEYRDDISEYQDDTELLCADEFDVGELGVPSAEDEGTTLDVAGNDKILTGRIEGAHTVHDSGRIEFPRIDVFPGRDLSTGSVRVRFPDGYTYTFPRVEGVEGEALGRYEDYVRTYGPLPRLPGIAGADAQLTPAFTHLSHPGLATLRANAERRAHALTSAHAWFAERDLESSIEEWKTFGADEVGYVLNAVFLPNEVTRLPWIGDVPDVPVPLAQMAPIAAVLLAGTGTISVPTALAGVIVAETASAAWAYVGAAGRLKRIQSAADGPVVPGPRSTVQDGLIPTNVTTDSNMDTGPYADEGKGETSGKLKGPALGEVGALARFQFREAVSGVTTAGTESGTETLRAAINSLEGLLEKQKQALVGNDPSNNLKQKADIEAADNDLRDSTVGYIECIADSITHDMKLLEQIRADYSTPRVAVRGDGPVVAGEPVTLAADTSERLLTADEIDSYEWEFEPQAATPDGDRLPEAATITGDPIEVAFPEPDTYEVTLTVETTDGGTFTATRRIDALVAGEEASPTQEARLAAPDGEADDYFGTAVALDGTTALVGASGLDTSAGGDAGAAYVFERAGGEWTQQATLTPDDGGSEDFFGESVALDGTTALVGAPGTTGNETRLSSGRGSAYVFERTADGWSQQAKLTKDGDAASFGASVALDGSTALIGVPEHYEVRGRPKEGSASVFERRGGKWTQQATLVNTDAAPGEDGFGSSVALDGSTALVGHPLEGFAGFDGATYVFERADGEWSQQAKLAGDEGTDLFGFSVALDGPTALVGAADDGDAGAAYVFERTADGWSQQANLAGDDGDDDDRFGSSVALDGGAALVGAFMDDDPADEEAGSAFLFERAGGEWTRRAKLAAAEGGAEGNLGRAVALDGAEALALAGAPASDDELFDSDMPGTAFVFGLRGEGGATPAPAPAPDVTGDGSPATDPDGDGLYEDVDGDGTFDVFDVQAFVDNFGGSAVQENPEKFNFDGEDGVNIFDVQALIDRL